jgi:transcription elongation factor GreA
MMRTRGGAVLVVTDITPQVVENDSFLDVDELRTRLGAALDRLSARLVGRIAETGADADTDVLLAYLRKQVATLGQITAGLWQVDAACLPARGAGYGSTVVVKNLETGGIAKYTLMVGALLDVNADHVSLASPVGQALLGRVTGDEILVRTPRGTVRYRIIRLLTIAGLADSLAAIDT